MLTHGGVSELIELKSISKQFGEVFAVNNLSLHVKRGETCVLLGPSGCGKSTTLRMINRLVDPTSGSIQIDGVDSKSYNVEKLRQSMGYVVQSTGLFPHMTVEKNIGIVPELLGWNVEKTNKRTHELLELVGLTPDLFSKKYPRALSGGEAQRVGVARALAANPEIILMDEPFGAVDPVNRKRLQNAFLDIQRHLHKTIIFVTHDVEEAIHMGDTIAIMNKGCLEAHGTPKQLLKKSHSEFVRQFLGKGYALTMLGKYTLEDALPLALQKSNTDMVPNLLMKSHTSLKYALSSMIENQLHHIGIEDADGKYLGSIHIADVIDVMNQSGDSYEMA